MMRWILILMGIGLSLNLAACGPNMGTYEATSAKGNSSSTTGFNNPTGVPYTAGGDDRVIEERKKQNEAQLLAADKALAENILSLRIFRYNQDGKIDRFGRSEIRGEIEFKEFGKLPFRIPLKSVAGHKVITRPTAISSSIQLEADFDDDSTQKFSRGLLKVYHLDEKKRPRAMAEIYLRSYVAAVNTSLSSDQTLNAVNGRYVQLLVQKSFGWVSNIVVQNGRSFYEVHLYAANDKSRMDSDAVDRFAAGRRLFTFAGDSLRTGDFASAPATRLDNGLMQPLSAALIGDAEEEDLRTFSVNLKGFQNQNIDLALQIQIEKPQKLPPNAGRKGFMGLSASSYLKVNYSDPTNPNIKKMIDDFERNYQLEGVQSWIRRFTLDENRRGNLVNALTYALPFRPVIQEIFHNYSVAPPAALVTFIESSFFASGTYKLETNPSSTASGPFQLLYGTAKYMGLKAFENPIGVLPQAGDHRLYFVPASCGAARHLKDSLNAVGQNDSTLVIAAYYLGNGGVTSALHKHLTGAPSSSNNAFDLVKRYNIRYMQVARQHMLPTHVVDYVNKALALYFITGNPKTHRLNWQELNNLPLPKGKVMPPFSEITDPICRASVMNLTNSKKLQL